MASISIEGHALDHAEPDNHVCHLDAGVIDVVLHFHRDAAEAQHPDERVAERGVPKVADVGGLVRIDRRMFDDGFAVAMIVRTGSGATR